MAKQTRSASPVFLEALCRLTGRRLDEETDVIEVSIAVPLALRGTEPVRITLREREALQLAARGLSTTRIAEAMYITPQAVRNLFHRLHKKLGVNNRVEAVVLALRHELIE